MDSLGRIEIKQIINSLSNKAGFIDFDIVEKLSNVNNRLYNAITKDVVVYLTNVPSDRVHDVVGKYKKLRKIEYTNVRNPDERDIVVEVLRNAETSDLFTNIKISVDIDDEDISVLGGAYTLNMNSLRDITEVSDLGGVHTLDLSHCESITDVSALGRVRNSI